MITAERRGVIAGSEEAKKKPNLQEHEIEQLANWVFTTMQKDGYAHIEPRVDFIRGFYQGFKFAVTSQKNNFK